jgi:hypothetical protein
MVRAAITLSSRIYDRHLTGDPRTRGRRQGDHLIGPYLSDRASSVADLQF